MILRRMVKHLEIVSQLLVVFICSVHLLSYNCPKGWTKLARVCYYLSTEEKNWVDAQAICKENNGKLAEPETQDAMDFVRKMLTENHCTGSYHLGGTDIQKEGEWVWDSTGIKINKMYWNKEEPNNKRNGENCLGIRCYPSLATTSGSIWEWNDHRCDSKVPYICEQSTEISAIEGENVFLQCPLTNYNYNDIKITWSKTHSLPGVPPLSERGVNTASPDLLITEVQWFDTGLYQCEVDMGLIKTTHVQNVTIKIDRWCQCDCSFRQNLIYWAFKLYGGATQEELAKELLQRLQQITDRLQVNRTKLSSYIRKKTSASDHRPSSQKLGYVGIAVIAVVVCLVVIIDMVAIGQCVSALRGKRAPHRRHRRTKIKPISE